MSETRARVLLGAPEKWLAEAEHRSPSTTARE